MEGEGFVKRVQVEFVKGFKGVDFVEGLRSERCLGGKERG